MFGFGATRWKLEFRNRKLGDTYILESESIGKLLGYIAIPLEEGLRPGKTWSVAIRHKSNAVFQLLPKWPEKNDPIQQLLEMATEINPRLIKARSEPKFFQWVNGKKKRLSLKAQIEGRPVEQMSLDERISAARSGSNETLSVFSLIRSAFEVHVDKDWGDELLVVKTDP